MKQLNLLPDWKYNSWLFVLVLSLCFALSVGVRYQQFEKWKKTPAAFFVGDRPMMTTLDAPYWLRWAREYKENTYGQKNDLRNYPGSTDTFQEMSFDKLSLPLKYKDAIKSSSTSSSSYGTKTINYLDVPLLSFLIGHLAPFFNDNYYLTGTLLIPALASLFILPLGIYFFKIGAPVPGLLGGLVGTFSGAYYMRSSIGRIDTDMLNLFFLVFAALLILLALKAKTERSVLLYALGTGLSMFLFNWWYSKAIFSWVYFAVLVGCLFVQHIRFRTILLSAFLFILAAHPGFFLGGTKNIQGILSAYFSIEIASEAMIDNVTTPASFPNTMTTISEVDHVPVVEVLRRVLSNTLFAGVGCFAFFGLTVLRWRVLLPLAPMMVLGLISFQSSNRFIMYLAPLIGIGLGWFLSLGLESIFLFLRKKDKEGLGQKGLAAKGGKNIFTVRTKSKGHTEVLGQNGTKGEEFQRIKWWDWTRQIVLYLGMGVFFWLISGQTAISFVPAPSIHTGLYATFLEVKKRVPEDSALLTWWDYGYAITDATGLATFHDGGAQTGQKTYFIARGLIGPDPKELYDITQYLATKGNRGIAENNTTPDALLEAVRNPKLKPWNPIYLFFTADMTGKYGAISKLGSWDIANGGSKPRGYQNLTCNKFTNEEMICRGAKIDFKAGKINNQVPLKRLVFIRDGQVLREQNFKHAQGYTLQLLVSRKQIVEVQLIDDVVFRSNYNQMFLLGRYDRELFEETYNAFPFSRLYRVKF